MKSRAFFLLVLAFWVTMNALLWRAEFGGGQGEGGSVPLEVVWQKILTAPDNSSLDIYTGQQKIGTLRWVPNVGHEQEMGKVNSEDYVPDGQVKLQSGYTIDVDAHARFPGETERVFFNLSLQFDPNEEWREIGARYARRPMAIDIRAHARERQLVLRLENGRDVSTQTMAFEDLQDPQKLLRLVPGAGPLTFLAGINPLNMTAPAKGANPRVSFQIPWEASYSYLDIRHTRIKTYRLHTKLLDRYDIDVQVSRVGEILKVELPNGIRLVSDALPGL
jgi:hypothetical protein